MTDENFQKEAKKYVIENGYVKGEANLTLRQFTDCMSEQKGITISISTASLWLHDIPGGKVRVIPFKYALLRVHVDLRIKLNAWR